MISKEEVKHIAKLARLGLTEKEIEKFQKELSSILDYVEHLSKVEVANIEPTSHSILIENVTREDKAEKENPERINRLIDSVPEEKDGYVKVKTIL